MPDDADRGPVFKVDVGAEVERFFDDTSLPGQDTTPRFVLLLGGVSSGKTYTRRGGYYDFPDGLADPLETIGSLVALRAVAERRNVVTEMLATDREQFEGVFRAMVGAGYHAEVVWIECDPAEGARRNAARGDLDISAAFCQEFHARWLLAAASQRRP